MAAVQIHNIVPTEDKVGLKSNELMLGQGMGLKKEPLVPIMIILGEIEMLEKMTHAEAVMVISENHETIERLQAENATLKERIVTLEKLEGIALIEALRAEVERLKADKATAVEKMHESANQFVEFMHGPHSQVATERDELRQQLAISQLEAKRLRESVDQYLIEHDPSNFDCACDLSVGYLCGPCFAHKQQTVAQEALSSPTSTDELDAYVAGKVKSARVIDEKQIAYLLEERSVFTRQRDLAVSAIENLVKQKGRHNTEIAYKKLGDVLATIKESEV